MQLSPSKRENRNKRANQTLSVTCRLGAQQQPSLGLPPPPLGLARTAGSSGDTAEKSLSGVDAPDNKDFAGFYTNRTQGKYPFPVLSALQRPQDVSPPILSRSTKFHNRLGAGTQTMGIWGQGELCHIEGGDRQTGMLQVPGAEMQELGGLWGAAGRSRLGDVWLYSVPKMI